MEDSFCIGMRCKNVAEIFQFGAEFEMIVNFSVEGDSEITVGGKKRLIAAGKIDNFQSSGAHGKKSRLKNALLIRSAMDERIRGLANALRRRIPIFICESDYAAQGCAPRKTPAGICSASLISKRGLGGSGQPQML